MNGRWVGRYQTDRVCAILVSYLASRRRMSVAVTTPTMTP